MEEEPSNTLNLIDRLTGEVKSPSVASSSNSDPSEHHRQLCAEAATFTLHQSWRQPQPCVTKKRKRKAPVREEEGESAAPPINYSKRRKVILCDDENNKDDEDKRVTLTVGQPQVLRGRSDPAMFKIKKNLMPSDLGNLSRLLVPKGMVKNHVLPLLGEELVQRVWSPAGLRVTVEDEVWETDYELTFKYLKSSSSYVFNGNWISHFVKRLDLKKDDEIGLYWDTLNSKFHFSVLKLANQAEVAPVLQAYRGAQ